MNVLFPLCFKIVTGAGPTSFRSSAGLVVGSLRKSCWRLGTSPTLLGFDEARASGEEQPEEIKGSGPQRREVEVEIDLDDEPRSVLDSLNVWREKVIVGELPRIPGLSRPVELELLDLLTSQLDRELIAYNTIVAGHKKRVDDVLKKGCELLEASSSLRKEKAKLEEKHLNRLLELQNLRRRVISLEEDRVRPIRDPFTSGASQHELL